MKLSEAIEKLQMFLAEHPHAADAEVLLEGCDCYGFMDGVRWTESDVLLTRVP